MMIDKHLKHPIFFQYLIAAAIVALQACGSSDGPQTPPPVVAPSVASVSDSVVAPGDTLIVTGNNFETAASSNRIVFNNPLATVIPLSATSDRLTVVVPGNANSGAMHVSSKGVNSNSVPMEIVRSVGAVWVMGEGEMFEFKLPSTTGTEEYLLIPLAASSIGSGNFIYSLSTDSAAAYPSTPRDAQRPAKKTLGMRFESDIRRQALDYVDARGRQSLPAIRQTALTDTTDFFVLDCEVCIACEPCVTNDAASYTTVTAALCYTGRRTLIYADVNQPMGSFDQTDYDMLGAMFDGQIYATDSTFFGDPPDIDSNNRVVILFTPRVNELTPDGLAASEGFISGFFHLNDLGPAVFPSGTSNGMEILYSMVPDPNGEFGNVFPKTGANGVLDDVPGTLAHEFEHLISFGYRFLDLGSGLSTAFVQEEWLEEGMAHMAEDLNGIDAQNILRAQRYLSGPDSVSIIGDDTIEQRGGIFLFLRYLGDQMGDDIYRTMLQSNCIGINCVQSVAGENFFTTVANFLAALYLSDRGITNNPRYNFSSFDMQTYFGPSPLKVTTRIFADGAFGGSVRSAAGAHHLFGGLPSPAAGLDFSGAPDGNMRVIISRIQ